MNYEITIGNKDVKVCYPLPESSPVCNVNGDPFDLWHLLDVYNGARNGGMQISFIKIGGNAFNASEFNELCNWAIKIENLTNKIRLIKLNK